MPLSIDRDDNKYTLAKLDSAGNKISSIELTEEEILGMAQHAQALRDRILAERTPSTESVSAISSSDVAGIFLNTDVHKTQIFLRMIDRNGAFLDFSLTPTLAQNLVDRIPARLAEIAEAEKTRTRQ